MGCLRLREPDAPAARHRPVDAGRATVTAQLGITTNPPALDWMEAGSDANAMRASRRRRAPRAVRGGIDADKNILRPCSLPTAATDRPENRLVETLLHCSRRAGLLPSRG